MLQAWYKHDARITMSEKFKTNNNKKCCFKLIKMSAYYTCCIYSNALQIIFIMNANTMNPDQTASMGSASSGFILDKQM